jgi:hypothetical protein
MTIEKTEVSTEQAYFVWLCELVHVQQENSSYYNLFSDLFEKPFRYSIEQDENRALDGLAICQYFCDEEGVVFEYDSGERPCSVLEVLIALAKRMDFEISDPDFDGDNTAKYFWEMLGNLGLTVYSDDMYYQLDGSFNVDVILNVFLDRTYQPDGHGGVFPLRRPSVDQRYIELWYQMNAYILEKEAAV